MFEKMRLKEHMEVVDAEGQHIGTVDEVEGDNIKLTRSDSPNDMHRFLRADDVDKIDDNRAYLKQDATIPGRTGTVGSV